MNKDFWEDLLEELKVNPNIERDVRKRGDLIRYLCENFYRVEEIIEILLISGFKPGYIDLQGSALHVWSDTIQYATSRGEFINLVKGITKYRAIKEINEGSDAAKK